MEAIVMYGYPDAEEDWGSFTPELDAYIGRIFARKGSPKMYVVTAVHTTWIPLKLVCTMDKNDTLKVTLVELREMEEVIF